MYMYMVGIIHPLLIQLYCTLASINVSELGINGACSMHSPQTKKKCSQGQHLKIILLAESGYCAWIQYPCTL